ncbi:hypothetical protein PAXRUDRAFT_19978 [Paxillus rubicundulus Ve08.2h10]|uniref:Unplaced genomic scaffold scaffold_4129, whole genome shotgun sequence n=1 Tax=Paxillus rubicundulus Ve08.2h10 TaxID=930991 RepID=A0A0D0DAW0_9AGAM|nr:hypothetical protein PAXRUDRAFT_19978 [Paxillus rubicundulus Ve08.2h10]
MPPVAQKAKFGIDVRFTPSESIKVSSPAQVIEALWEQITPPACIQSLSRCRDFIQKWKIPIPNPLSSHWRLRVSPHHTLAFSWSAPLLMEPHLGVEMEDDASGDTSNGDAGPHLPIPPPLTDLVPPIESFSSEVDMELDDVDMEKE